MKSSAYLAAGLLVASILLAPACEWFQNVPLVSEAAEVPLIRIIDMNTTKVYDDAHIPGALNVALSDLEKIAKEWNKDTPIITYCSDYNCMASHKAAQTLSELGFSDVSVYAGGISEWYKLSKENKIKYPIEGPAQMPFLAKDIEMLDSDKEETNVISADEVANRIQQHMELKEVGGIAKR